MDPNNQTKAVVYVPVGFQNPEDAIRIWIRMYNDHNDQRFNSGSLHNHSNNNTLTDQFYKILIIAKLCIIIATLFWTIVMIRRRLFRLAPPNQANVLQTEPPKREVSHIKLASIIPFDEFDCPQLRDAVKSFYFANPTAVTKRDSISGTEMGIQLRWNVRTNLTTNRGTEECCPEW